DVLDADLAGTVGERERAVEQLADDERLRAALLEPPHVDQTGREHGAGRDRGDARERHEQAPPARDLDNQPDGARLAGRSVEEDDVLHPPDLVAQGFEDVGAREPAHEDTAGGPAGGRCAHARQPMPAALAGPGRQGWPGAPSASPGGIAPCELGAGRTGGARMRRMSFMQAPRDPRLSGQPRGDEIAAYETYAEAQRAVDFLADSEFPVQKVTIVGTDLKMVERITGRRTYATAALQGAASGMWLGLFLGLMFMLLSPGADLVRIFLPAVLIGAGFGMLWGVVGHALTGGRRDFSSTSQVMASRFAVLCLSESAAEARNLLATMPAEGDTGRTVDRG